MKLSSYLSRSRHGVYYFRWPIASIDNKKRTNIKISLRTKCPNQAGDIARHLTSSGRYFWDNKDLARLRQDQIRELVQAYFKAQLDQYLEWLNSRGFTPNALEDMRCEEFDHTFHSNDQIPHPRFLPIARFKRKMTVSDTDWDDSHPSIAIELHKGRRDMLRSILEAAERLEHYSYSDQGKPTLTLPPAASSPLGQTVNDFMDEHSRQWPSKTAKQFRAYLNILLEHFGADRLLETITRQDASEVKRIMQTIPASRNTKPELKDLPLSEVIRVAGHKTMSAKTINSHIDTFRRFFDWAERHGHAPHKLFEGLKVPKAREAETDRKAFNQTQTQLLFDELTQNKSGYVRKDSHKWASLIGLFTGARLNEICQLELADVQQEAGIWFLNITDEGDNNKRVKAKASRRKVPVHSELIRLGFNDFVHSRQRHQRLFHDYSYNSNGGYGRNLGRWYNESFLPKLGMKERGLVFHSLRHTVVSRLSQADVPEPVIQCLIGHARAGVTQEVYNKGGFSLRQLQDATERFSI